jgi:photosystem II stability/assembly factor-like uncharacterized protein
MSDDERFERDLRDVILRDVPPAAPGELRASVHRIANSRPVSGPRFRWLHNGPRLAAGLAAVLLVALVGGLLLFARPAVGPSASPSPTASANPVATASAPAASFTAVASLAVGPEVNEFGLTDAEHGWVLSDGRIYLTADGGRTWTFALELTEPRSTPLITFLDAQHGWIVPLRSIEDGPAIIQRTVDGGRTWQQASIPSVYGVPGGLRFFDSAHGLLAFDGWGGKPGSLWSSSDGGATWARVASLPVAVVGAVSFSDPHTGWALAASNPNPPTGRGATNELYVTRDGGNTWERSVLPAPPAGWTADAWLPEMSSTLSVFGPGEAVLAAWYGNGTAGETQLLVTRDAGASWSVAATISSLFPVPVDALDAQDWIAASPDEAGIGTITLKATTDGGRTWHSIGDVTAGGANYLQLAFADRQHGWVLDNPVNAALQLYATDDGGASWRLLSPSGGPTRTPVPCSADNVLLGPMPAPASGPTTPWFNLFALNFGPATSITITFDKPVIAWPGEGAPSGPIHSLTVMPASDGSTKLSFRPADAGVTRIVVRMNGGTCSATTTVDLTAAAP